MVGGIAVGAAVRTWPFRVFSFPTEIHAAPQIYEPCFDAIMTATLSDLRADVLYDNFFVDTPFMEMLKKRINT